MTEVELYAAVSIVQDRLYVMNILELPMVLEVDNMRDVYLGNNWNVLGRAKHIDVQQCFLQELKEKKNLLIVK